RRAELVCEAVEQLMRRTGSPESRAEELSLRLAEWEALEPSTLSTALTIRFEGASTVIQAQLAPPPVVEAPAEVDALSADEPASAELDTDTPPSPEEIAAQAKLQADIAASAERAARERAKADEQRRADDRRREEQDGILARLADALAAGDLSTARSLSSSIEPRLLSTSGQRAWQSLQPQLKTLEG